MRYITITQDEDAWRQLLSILQEVNHGPDEKLIVEFTAKVEKALARPMPEPLPAEFEINFRSGGLS